MLHTYLVGLLHDPIVGYWVRRLTGYCNCGQWFDQHCMDALTEERAWALEYHR